MPAQGLIGIKLQKDTCLLSQINIWFCKYNTINSTVLPAKSDSDVMFCLQSYQGLRIERQLVDYSYPQDTFYYIYIYIYESASGVFKVIFYLIIVNKT